MKRFMLNTFLLSLAVALCGCGGSEDDPKPAEVIINVSPETINAPAEGGTYTVSVTTTGKEWGTAMGEYFFTVKTQNTAAQSGTMTITVPANPVAEARSGAVTVMSGTARKTVTVNQAAAEKAAYNAPEGYTLVWQDEFNEGTELNSADWTHEVQKDHWVNNELQNYVNHQSPKGRNVTEIMGGALHINCFKEDGKIYSGRVYAHVNQGWQYGYFEASIKLPKGKGTWPAFWMMPVGNDWGTNPWPMCGEIDIMEEVGCVPNEVSSSIHTQDYNHTKGTQKTNKMTISKAEGEFHTYALLWTADEIITYVDGKVQLSVNKSVIGSSHNQWPFHYAFYPIFNLAWGGDWGGMNGVDENALPVTMEVDYIRVFQKK
ncbi:MAG: family 16 glycosylhydrolase [Prevotella sp.]|nr:family 16 glycosylhydrolase [Prevotella sp.]